MTADITEASPQRRQRGGAQPHLDAQTGRLIWLCGGSKELCRRAYPDSTLRQRPPSSETNRYLGRADAPDEAEWKLQRKKPFGLFKVDLQGG